jgi:hypothetical protein
MCKLLIADQTPLDAVFSLIKPCLDIGCSDSALQFASADGTHQVWPAIIPNNWVVYLRVFPDKTSVALPRDSDPAKSRDHSHQRKLEQFYFGRSANPKDALFDRVLLGQPITYDVFLRRERSTPNEEDRHVSPEGKGKFILGEARSRLKPKKRELTRERWRWEQVIVAVLLV